ncbi:hypothetical protein [Actinomycetospora atypica]|uniref:Uncharacterized protein n=1 Tax=Actinomycetospora atypica TaxID=1290095 RepID=A0ABV9YNP3_9PSEU
MTVRVGWRGWQRPLFWDFDVQDDERIDVDGQVGEQVVDMGCERVQRLVHSDRLDARGGLRNNRLTADPQGICLEPYQDVR